MILAVPEYTAAPASPAQWDRYYNLTDDKLYIQTVATSDPSYPAWIEMAEGAAVRNDMRHQITLTRSLYSAKDYQTFLDEIIAYIAERWGDQFNDFMASDAAMMIAEYVAAAFDQLSWYMDRGVDDWYMELARVSSNVARLARYLGYKPSPGVAASVDLAVTLTNGPYSFDVTLNEGHEFEGPNSLIFELGSNQTIPAGDTTKTVGVFQGKTYSETFVSDGTANQQFNLSLVPSSEFLALGKTKVYVGVDEWDEEDFLPYEATEVFEVLSLTSPPRIRFGNGIIGKIPPQGSEVRVSYVATKGNTAGLATAGTISKSNTTVVVNFQTIPITVTNPSPPSGGSPAEDIESIKTQAPRYFLAADRLVTSSDYAALATQFSSVSGAVAKAFSIIVRGAAQDLELQSLLDALTADKDTLDGYLTAIKENQGDIDAIIGSITTTGTIRFYLEKIREHTDDVRLQTSQIDTNVITLQGYLSDADDEIGLAQTRLDYLPFQEVLGQGNGTTTLFTGVLAKTPIMEGSTTVLVSDKTPTKSATNGDCDATPGRLSSATIGFVSTDVGKMIRIGGEYRQIQKYVSATAIEYSGPRIYGTSLLVDVYPAAIIGYSDAAGVISGSGIASGTVNQTSGAISVTFSTAPEGITGKYGVPIIVSYQYKGESIKGVLDDALTQTALATTLSDSFTVAAGVIDGKVDDIDDYTTDVETENVNIEAETADTVSIANSAGFIPDQIDNDIDALNTYLDTVLSSACKANIVRTSCLVLDANGFYTAPSIALKDDLKAYLDERKIRTIQNSVVGGDYYLVKVKLSIEIKVLPLFVFQTVEEAVAAAVDEMFKGRDYEEPLLRSEYYGVVDGVDGVDYSNITITDTAYVSSLNPETPPSADSNGNLFIGDYEVITKWDVTISQIEG